MKQSKFTTSLLEIINNTLELLPGLETPYQHARRLRGLPPVSHRHFQRTISRFQKQGWIKKREVNQKYFYELTKRGKIELLWRKLKTDKTQKKWDKKWRILIFDIPEKEKKLRDFLREKLKSLEFVKLQESVWIYPFKVESSLKGFLQETGIWRHTCFLVADVVENDSALRKHFCL